MNKQSLEEFIAFSEETFSKKIIMKGEKSTVFLLNFEPGQSLPPHPHPNADVYAVVWEGSGVFMINKESFQAEKGTVVHCRGEETLSFRNDSNQRTTLYVTLAKD
ncbi:cupin domain-containing protein [Bacillus thermotolerans]|uniref:Cupin type-2 domain-containing protein n=1 Tax=Bacillus thermotolerans TaxID=1221996 RepID=A0A0F5HPQ9_BACTR|nr:cupin domain-containing protein [Bacillus thermotolerans]KKB34822.1 hypothetical protein QY97_02130 [Bacillus thermotolerans]KKB37187.1 hypothetical protein QY96_03355 [Bacillus thermotolerans]KKB43362.1 hypothetical protein QY95_01607 [Bacillus thermotolerans]